MKVNKPQEGDEANNLVDAVGRISFVIGAARYYLGE